MNLYSYVGQNPVNFGDPLGLKPYEKFNTMDEAGVNAIQYINPISIKVDIEYCGWIYETSDGCCYSYTEAKPGTPTGCVYGPKPGLATGYTIGNYHSHGDYRKGFINEGFGTKDKSLYWGDMRYGYLGTPSGAIKKYEHRSRNTYVYDGSSFR